MQDKPGKQHAPERVEWDKICQAPSSMLSLFIAQKAKRMILLLGLRLFSVNRWRVTRVARLKSIKVPMNRKRFLQALSIYNTPKIVKPVETWKKWESKLAWKCRTLWYEFEQSWILNGKRCKHVDVSIRMHEIFNAEDMYFVQCKYYNRKSWMNLHYLASFPLFWRIVGFFLMTNFGVFWLVVNLGLAYDTSVWQPC